jgi:hypothetical protein
MHRLLLLPPFLFLFASCSFDRPPDIPQQAKGPARDNERYAWVRPQPDAATKDNCGNCHAEIVREWDASGHASSATNRRFLNLYEGTDWQGRSNVGWNLLADHPDGSGVCTACHAPGVRFEDKACYDLRQVGGVDASGVHCDFCHKVRDVSTTDFGLTHGRFALEFARPTKGQIFFGPFADMTRAEDVYSPIFRDSRFCAACHEGTVFGVHVYSSYSEWLDSAAQRQGKSCQTCHMAPTGAMRNMAPGHGGKERDPSTLGNHLFFAKNHLEMLRSCLKLAVRLDHACGDAKVTVRLSADEVGHQVPTGFVDRNIVLALEAFDQDGKPLVPTTGQRLLPQIAGKGFAGLAGRLYAKRLKDFDGHEPVPFWRADPQFSDERLVPSKPDEFAVRYAGQVRNVRVRLVHRRFWPEVATIKNWPDDSLVVWDRTLTAEAGKADWSSHSAAGP